MIIHLSIPKTDFDCLGCGQTYNVDFYEKALEKSNKGFIYKRCKGCGQTIGISTDMTGDVVTWLKKHENKSNELLNS